VQRLVHVRDVLWYAVNKTDLDRLVIVRDPDGVEPDDFFITTDRAATGAAVASRYADRWSIEVCFRDVKQALGGQDPQTWKRYGPRRTAALSLWLHAATWCWYLQAHPTGQTWIPRPWYRHKTMLQHLYTERRYFSVDPGPTDAVLVAQASGLDAVRVHSLAHLRDAVSSAIEARRAIYIDVPVHHLIDEVPPVSSWQAALAGDTARPSY